MPSTEVPLSASDWWARRRRTYNLALVAAGIFAFIAYVTIVWSFPEALPDAEITLFTVPFQAVAYLLAIGVANLCYFVGPLSERVLKPRRVETYRAVAYGLGFWCSVLLVLAVPALALVAVTTA